jgi:carbon monoxide dehydrogenase subunit G
MKEDEEMMKLSASVCVDAPVSKVWSALSELEAIHTWSDSIHHSYCESENSRGVDAVRVCELNGNVKIRETIVAWEEGQSFTYVGQGIPLIRRAKNKWSVEERGRKTLVTSLAEVEIKGGILGRLLEPIMLLASKQLAYKSLGAFKYLVENDEPCKGKAKNTLSVPTIC